MRKLILLAMLAGVLAVPAAARNIEPANEENGGGGYFVCTEIPPGYLIFWNGSHWEWTGKFC